MEKEGSVRPTHLPHVVSSSHIQQIPAQIALLTTTATEEREGGRTKNVCVERSSFAATPSMSNQDHAWPTPPIGGGAGPAS